MFSLFICGIARILRSFLIGCSHFIYITFRIITIMFNTDINIIITVAEKIISAT